MIINEFNGYSFQKIVRENQKRINPYNGRIKIGLRDVQILFLRCQALFFPLQNDEETNVIKFK